MNILITGASTLISRHLAAVFRGTHTVTLTDRIPVSGVEGLVQCDLGDGRETNELVRGADVIIHPGQVDVGISVSDQLDGAMRCLYNLLRAACEEEVLRIVFLSSLSVMSRYDEGYVVTESWRPAPTTESAVLSFHLGEFICREFAREHKIEVVCLRLGDLIWDPDGAPSTCALYPQDAVQAVELSLTADISEGYAESRSHWGLFHIQSGVPNQRFLTTAAEIGLRYTPSAGNVR